jgi:putative peptide modification system cyclase
MSSVVEPHADKNGAEHDVPRGAADGPQLRTLLLTDLVDSTALVEQLGDGPAADLFREHDRLVVELQQRWRGRLIDRSDGLLLLFERAIDGLGFALDYNRGLRAIGESRKVTLQARTGLHVGEVLSWRNSDVAVSLGAKPLEVEGLAKPFAARLMTLARPGQILLSAVAEPLAHRAARELGERGEQLLWKSYGRWCFKGIPEAQEIYEVGEAGVAPLRAPKSTAKSWRDIPFWRRPAALGAELLLVAGLATGTWFLTRPQPAIAFGERDWVVVGDLRNLTGDKLLDDSLQQAFRISLEQSRFVNVLSDLKSRDTLALMQRKPGTALDRAIASEIALRDGARAVILPTVSEVGGRVRVSAEVIDPHTQTTVYAESADGTGAASTLGSIDTVTAALRGKLGEALQSIEKDSEPLPRVATGNLDALRAYALAQEAYAQTKYPEAFTLYEQATALDKQFALAWIGQAKARFATFDATAAMPALTQAQKLRARLAPREALYLDGWVAEFNSPVDALGKWELMTRLYPDFMPAQINVAIRLIRTNRFADAIPFAQRATRPQYDLIGRGFDYLGRAKLGVEDYKGASAAFAQAVAHRSYDSQEQRAQAAAAMRNFGQAQSSLKVMPREKPNFHLQRAVFLVDQGELDAARSDAATALKLSDKSSPRWLASLFTLASAEYLAGDADAARHRVQELAAQLPAALSSVSRAESAEVVGVALSGALLAQRMQDRALANRMVAATSQQALLASPELAELVSVVRANDARLAGHPDGALAQLKALLTGHELFQTRQALFETHIALARTEGAIEQGRWLQAKRGLAYAELTGYQSQQILNVADSNLAALRMAELLRAAGAENEARQALANFDKLWPREKLPAYLRERRARLDASSAGGV